MASRAGRDAGVGDGRVAALVGHVRGLFGDHDGRAVLVTSMVSFVLRALGVVLITTVTILFTRLMGPEEYGRVAFLLSGSFIIVLFAGCGLPTASSRLVPRYLGRGRHAEAQHYLIFGLVFLGVLAAIVGAGFAAMLHGVPSWFGAYALSPWTLIGFVVSIALMRFVSECGRAFGFQFLGFAAEGVIARAFLLIALLIYLWLGSRPSAEVALFLWVLAQSVTVVIVVAVMLCRLRPDRTAIRRRPTRVYRAWLGTASMMLMTPIFYFLLFETDIIVLGLLAGPYDVGVYQVARRLAELAVFCSGAVSAVGLPRLARAHAERRTDRLQATVDMINLIGIVTTAGVVAGLVVLGPYGLALFGPEFSAGYTTLIVLAIGRLIAVMLGPASDLLLMTGHHQRLGRVNLFFAFLNLALNLLLVPALQSLGAAIATSIASVGWSICLYRIGRRHTAIETCVLRRMWSGGLTATATS